MGIWDATKILVSIGWVILMMVGAAQDFRPEIHNVPVDFFLKAFALSAPVWLYWGAVARFGQQRVKTFFTKYSILYRLPLLVLATSVIAGEWQRIWAISSGIDLAYMTFAMLTLWLGIVVALFYPVLSAWKRYLARAFDYLLHTLVVGIVLYIAKELGCTSAFIMLVAPDTKYLLLYGLLVVWTWVPVEALLTQRFGTTPGKALFKVELHPLQKKTTYKLALKRALKVVVLGVGGGLPVVDAAAQGYSYLRLRRGKPLGWTAQTFSVATPTWPIAQQWVMLGGLVLLWLGYTAFEQLTGFALR